MLITDQNGKRITTVVYTPFGEVYEDDDNDKKDSYGLDSTTFKFTGQEFDEEIGLAYYGGRYYSPTLGRFLIPDSIVPNWRNPQDYNRYAYVRNNPIIYTDPSGHSPCGTDYSNVARSIGCDPGDDPTDNDYYQVVEDSGECASCSDKNDTMVPVPIPWDGYKTQNINGIPYVQLTPIVVKQVFTHVKNKWPILSKNAHNVVIYHDALDDRAGYFKVEKNTTYINSFGDVKSLKELYDTVIHESVEHAQQSRDEIIKMLMIDGYYQWWDKNIERLQYPVVGPRHAQIYRDAQIKANQIWSEVPYQNGAITPMSKLQQLMCPSCTN